LSRLMTLKEIAKQLEVPESSLRKYREIFSAFIPSVGTGRSRRYRTDAIEVLKDIRDLREDMHMPWDAITDQLAKKYPIDATPAAPVVSAVSERPAQQFQAPRQIVEVQPAAPQEQQQALSQAGSQYLKKMMAISEKQTMMVNALAIEMMREIGRVRKEAREDCARLQTNMAEVIKSLSKSLGVINQQERALLREIQGQIKSMEQTVDKLAGQHDQTIEVVQLQEQLKIIKEKIEQRESAIQEYKKSFTVLKKENTELREFKMRHIDKAEDRVREVKAMKHQSPLKRFLGFKS
jgi:DNA-binding transcriptional MerR regulator